jgi:ferrous iron transport protein B
MTSLRADKPGAPSARATALRVALLGNPNTGKTTLFNRLCGLRHKTSNFPGTTLEARVGRLEAGDAAHSRIEIVDLPGIYSLELDQHEAAVCRGVLDGTTSVGEARQGPPDALCIVVDATNLLRNLTLAAEAARRRLPTVVAVNMIDLAERRGLRVDTAALGAALGCPVVPVCARSGAGVEALKTAMTAAAIPTRPVPPTDAGVRAWAQELFELSTTAPPGDDLARETFSDRLDRAFTHPVLGLFVFAGAMTALFYALFVLAAFPMEWIESVFGGLAEVVRDTLPEGLVREFLADGVVGGVGATLVFLPQIALLFFLISLLEDTGYLARAAFVMDRALRPFGLPGHSFVPLLSSHACALPGIMACRAIPDRRERLATILVAPFMTCSARLPVYVLLTSLLFKGRPLAAALAFVGCYALGIAAGLVTALVARRTLLRGRGRPMALELPSYKAPSLRTALITTYDRSLVFLKNAGTNILMVCVALWWLGSFPKVDPPAEAVQIQQQIVDSIHAWKTSPPTPEEMWAKIGPMQERAEELERRHAAAHSFMGRIGRAVQPVFAPLGYDWQLTVGVMASFAAREVFVSTMSIVVAGQDESDGDARLMDRIGSAKRDDGVTPVFTDATCWSLLVYYVLAMQCLPTLAVTAREAGGKKWALLQLVWMSVLAYAAAFVAFSLAS